MRTARRNKAKRFLRENFASCKAIQDDGGRREGRGAVIRKGGGVRREKKGVKKGEEVRGRKGESRWGKGAF